MLIGIISDTHDNLDSIRKAVKIFKEKNVDMVIHCGDISSTSTINFFSGIEVHFVQGNCDFDTESKKIEAMKIGSVFHEGKYEFIADDKNIMVYHGWDLQTLNDMISSGLYDYILTGHTHEKEDRLEEKTRIINPGAHKQGEHTIAILDTKKNTVDFIRLNHRI